MSIDQQHTVDILQAQAFLTHHLGTEPSGIVLLGEGAWSQCFGFVHDGQDLVIRFGKYVSDFQKDQLAYRYANSDLPIPEVIEIGAALDGYYAISTRVYGIPLESVPAEQWLALVPAIVAALEAMRLADLSATKGSGGWGAEGQAAHGSWRSYLLGVAEDDGPDPRGHGWHERLAMSPDGQATFDWGLNLLKQVADNTVPRCLVHGDLMNRNVFVDADRITGVFDWGCSIYGDHLYDLALIEFWSPWYPTLDIEALRTALEQRWLERGYSPENKVSRLQACYLHIGLEHLAYHAHLGNWKTVLEIAQRMRALIPE